MKKSLVRRLAVVAVVGVLAAQYIWSTVSAQEQATAEHSAAAQLSVLRSGPEPSLAIAPFDAEQARKHQEAWAKHLGLSVEWTNSIGMKFVLIPPGEFMMGSADSAEDTARPFEKEGAQAAWFQDEHPLHRVRLTKWFGLSVYEVTQAQFERVMRTNPSHFKAAPGHPVEMVSWDNAVAFCNRLSALAEEKAAGRAYRLPTEAEWEYACRAGSTLRYSFGNDAADLDGYGWFMGNSAATPHPAGQKQPNYWGLYDVYGNVLEWCQDWYFEGSTRVIRGGWRFDSAMHCRSAYLSGDQPGNRGSYLGFRVASVPSSQ